MTNKTIRKTISIDPSRSVPREDRSGIVLMFDERSGCYYETSVASISSAFISELRKVEKELRDAYGKAIREAEEKCKALESELREQQRKFIRDTADATDKLINLVEANKS